MFTFGRDHEKNCEARLVRNPAQIPLLMNVIDAIHDLIDGNGDLEYVRTSVHVAMTEGGAGVWENAAKWLRKTGFDYPDIISLWSELASHSNAEVRFRVASLLDEVPIKCFGAISSALLKDRSKRVVEMAVDRSARVGGTNAG